MVDSPIIYSEAGKYLIKMYNKKRKKLWMVVQYWAKKKYKMESNEKCNEISIGVI